MQRGLLVYPWSGGSPLFFHFPGMIAKNLCIVVVISFCCLRVETHNDAHKRGCLCTDRTTSLGLTTGVLPTQESYWLCVWLRQLRILVVFDLGMHCFEMLSTVFPPTLQALKQATYRLLT